jgi:hypothetical protein
MTDEDFRIFLFPYLCIYPERMEQINLSNKINITSEMRDIGAAILSDQDLGFSYEERAAAVYIAMEYERVLPPLPKRRSSRRPSQT